MARMSARKRKTESIEGFTPDSAWRQRLRRSLLAWFARHARDLPWRRSRDPYRVWISEVMLQQTQVATVEPYFRRFIERFPDVVSLAAAREEVVLRLWEGLGYYRRARQLHAAAQKIVAEHGGVFPRDFVAVLDLPGVGRYTAGAVCSIAYDARTPILEANSIRVLSRLSGYRDDPLNSRGQQFLWKLATLILPRKDVGRFNQAVMELGSEVCSPKAPQCENCPLIRLCAAHDQGLQEKIPLPKRKTKFEDVLEAAVVVASGEKVLIRQCGFDERWAGLWDFPRLAIDGENGTPIESQLSDGVRQLTGCEIEMGDKLTTLKHGVTRFRITLDCYRATLIDGEPKIRSATQRWLPLEALEDVPLSVTGRKIHRFLLRQVGCS
jgi:A/G-specific adenine glycosylase